MSVRVSVCACVFLVYACLTEREMDGQRDLGGGQGPDAQVVDLGDAPDAP